MTSLTAKLFNRADRAAMLWRAMILRGRSVTLGAGCTIEPGVRVSLGFARGRAGQVRIGARCQLSTAAVLDCWGGAIELGEYVFVGPHCVIYGHAGVSIGRGTMLSMHTTVLSSQHTIPSHTERIRDMPDRLLPTVIDEDVWVGAGAIIMGGVHVGRGCVIGAGAVVTKDVPAYSIAVGAPARVIRSRE